MTSEFSILRALAQEPQTTRQLQMRLSATTAKHLTEQIVLRMQARGLIAALKGGKWQLTAAGYSMLPTAQPVRPVRPYKPPRVIRRAGSDAALKLPSIFAGRIEQ